MKRSTVVNGPALLPEQRPKRWHHGMSPRNERIFNWIAGLLVSVMVTGWTIAIVQSIEERRAARRAAAAAPDGAHGIPDATTPAAPVTRRVTEALLDERSQSTAYLNDAALAAFLPLRGKSGAVNLAVRKPGEPLGVEPGDPRMAGEYEGDSGTIHSPEFAAPEQPGVYKLAVQLDEVKRALDLNVITLVPFQQKKSGRIGLYYLGSWPYEKGGKPKSAAYANPRGFIEVTPQNRTLHVSEHFQLGDFLTKGQSNVWPKYLLLDPRMLDKLELVIDELEAKGTKVTHVAVMSAFRTPDYNESGGNTAGRANLSRHMFGDAADIYIDNDRNGVMDDLNRNGRSDTGDSEVLAAAADRVEKKYPALVGGVGIYKSCCGHGPFTHIDVRGYRARWR